MAGNLTRRNRSSHRRCSIKKGVLKNCASVSFLRPATLLKTRLWHRYFPVNFAKILRTAFLQNTSRRLLLRKRNCYSILFLTKFIRYSAVAALTKFARFTKNHLCRSIFFNKVVGLQPATLLKKRLRHKCFRANLAKFSRTPFLQNTTDGCFYSGSYVTDSPFTRMYMVQWKKLKMFLIEELILFSRLDDIRNF